MKSFMLTRLGNKRRLKNELYYHFPRHKLRVELFFGAGGSFFSLPKPQYSILNDLDDDVTNLYKVLLTNKSELIRQIKLMPISESLLKYWRVKQETEPVKKAIRFLLISNFTYLGKGDNLRLGIDNTKKILIDSIEPTFDQLQNSKILNRDFREVLPNISFSETVTSKADTFVYLDPIYLDTTHTYKVPSWSKKDTEDCFLLMQGCGIRCVMSEFDNEMVMDLASKYKMEVSFLTDRNNLKNRRREVVIKNFSTDQISLF